MRSESGSSVDAPPAGSGSSERCASPPSAAEQSLIEALHGLVRQMESTNAHLLMMASQNSRMMEQIAFLLDLLLRSEQDEEHDARVYLDGSPIS